MEPKRFFPAVLVGGAAAGFFLALPILGDILRCALCIGVMAGSLLSMKLWLDTHRAENLRPMEGAFLGGLSGAISGGVSWLISVPIRIGFGEQLGDFYMERQALPTFAKYNIRSLYTGDFASIIISLPLQVVVYAAMGALGGFAALEYVFKSRRDAAPPA